MPFGALPPVWVRDYHAVTWRIFYDDRVSSAQARTEAFNRNRRNIRSTARISIKTNRSLKVWRMRPTTADVRYADIFVEPPYSYRMARSVEPTGTHHPPPKNERGVII